MTTELPSIFPFDWSCIDNTYSKTTEIYIWGWNKANESTCVRVNNFEIPIWVQLPEEVTTDSGEKKPLNWIDKSSIGYDNRLKTV